MSLSDDLSQREAIEQLWLRGVLHWKLDSAQIEIYKKITEENHKITVVNVARQVGKSTTMIVLALETCMSKPDMQVKYCAGQAKAVGKILRPAIRKFLQECPVHLKPKFDRIEGCYKFLNGSVLYLEGLNSGQADDLRGTPANLIIVDEAGFIDDLEYAVNSVLLPMTSTTKGRIVIISTPPRSAGHELSKFIQRAELDGAYLKLDINQYLEKVKNDKPAFKDRLPASEIARLKLSSRPSDWDREYLCLMKTDKDHAIVPEFTAEVIEETVRDWERPVRYDAYVSMDLGVKDFTGILFAYFDFKKAKLVIEDELLYNGQYTRVTNIVDGIKAKEKELWTSPITNKQTTPHKRICDTNEQIAVNEMRINHELEFLPTKKDGKEAALNDVRDRIAGLQIIINPRCKNLIFQLKNGTWAKNRKTYDRSVDGGHYDLVDSLTYLVRNVDWQKNPYPRNWGLSGESFRRTAEEFSDTASVIRDLFYKPKK